jgi:hypothetical protein
MKLNITFKTPDAVDYALKDIESKEEQEDVKNFLSKFISGGEYITICFDTDVETATVVKKK